MKKATQESLDAQGWLKTGDIARYEDGYLYITGRIKDIIVLANGEKISPTDIEAAIALDLLIEQVMIIGEGRPYLVALLVLNPEELQRWLEKVASKRADADADVLDIELKQRIRDRTRPFPGYARIHHYCIVDEAWSIENELLTPTLKLKRARVLERYAEQVKKLYDEHT